VVVVADDLVRAPLVEHRELTEPLDDVAEIPLLLRRRS
jgi:hypothetical protein